MANNFTTSVNILRDKDRDFNYIPTPNAKQVVNQIVNDFKKGLRSFNIVGTYGTGKSSFLLAFEQSVNGKKRYFEPNFISESNYEFIKIIGSYNSIIERFADIFNVQFDRDRNEKILSEIFNKYYSIKGNQKVLFILIDEFGKFLEYASKHNPEDELFFLQQLAEFCNNPKHNIVLITTVHQSLDSYAYSLSNAQKQEWTKVKGRFREITFNEPVEQLLYLAAEHLNKNEIPGDLKQSFEKSLDVILKTKAFNFNNSFSIDIAEKLFPIDLLAANILTLSLQKYGQNERSLFSFLEATDHTSLSKFKHGQNLYYNISNVYDYLNFNFYSFLTSKYNPDFSAWASIRNSIDSVERIFDKSINDYIKAVKVIGLLNIYAATGSNIGKDFLINYLEFNCNVSNASQLIKNLEDKKIIRFRTHNNRYILFEGTDLDIETAIIEAANKVSEVVDIASSISKHIRFSPVFAKQYSYEKGTPRYFDFRISDYPINIVPTGEIDGFVNFIFNENITESDVKSNSKKQEEAIIYCYFKNSSEIKDLLFEIEKVQRVIEENKEDKVAKRELENIFESQIRLLNYYITESIFSDKKSVLWFFKGEQKEVKSKKDFNKLLSQVCSTTYNATPVFVNELVNKHKISSSIHTAKRSYFRALTNNWNEENLGFEDSKFPPEKTIYLSLLKENGISPSDNKINLSIENNSSFYQLWKASLDFLIQAKTEQLKISVLSETLSKKPFKLKQGLIDFWLPTFIFLKRDEFAIFNESSYIPNLSEENLELIAKYPQKYSIKTFDVEGVKLDIFNTYRSFLNQTTDTKVGNNSFIETIKPFIIFYKQLPEYSKNTKRLSPTALKIREAIAKSKDPEITFFESFPTALGYNLNVLQKEAAKLQQYTLTLQEAVRELRTAYDEYVKRFEDFICTEIIGETVAFDFYKNKLQKRFNTLKKHLLLSNQKTLVQRIDSGLDDRKAWLNSIAQAVTGRTLEMSSDEDEVLLYEKFKSIIIELDSLTELSNTDVDDSLEEVMSVKIDSFLGKSDQKVVRIPRNKNQDIEQLKEALIDKLGKDKTINIAAVANLLKELLG
jgi:hypothetical protein